MTSRSVELTPSASAHETMRDDVNLVPKAASPAFLGSRGPFLALLLAALVNVGLGAGIMRLLTENTAGAELAVDIPAGQVGAGLTMHVLDTTTGRPGAGTPTQR